MSQIYNHLSTLVIMCRTYFFFWTGWHELCLSIKKEREDVYIYNTRWPSRDPRNRVDPEKTHETAPVLQPKSLKLRRCVTKSPLVKHKILLNSFHHLLHRLEFVVKNTPVPLFPQIPHNVYHQTVEITVLILVHSLYCFLPPTTDAIKICRIGLLGERPVLPR